MYFLSVGKLAIGTQAPGLWAVRNKPDQVTLHREVPAHSPLPEYTAWGLHELPWALSLWSSSETELQSA